MTCCYGQPHIHADVFERDVSFLIESGGLFHNIGAEKEKARSPYVTDFTVGH